MAAEPEDNKRYQPVTINVGGATGDPPCLTPGSGVYKEIRFKVDPGPGSDCEYRVDVLTSSGGRMVEAHRLAIRISPPLARPDDPVDSVVEIPNPTLDAGECKTYVLVVTRVCGTDEAAVGAIVFQVCTTCPRVKPKGHSASKEKRGDITKK